MQGIQKVVKAQRDPCFGAGYVSCDAGYVSCDAGWFQYFSNAHFETMLPLIRCGKEFGICFLTCDEPQ